MELTYYHSRKNKIWILKNMNKKGRSIQYKVCELQQLKCADIIIKNVRHKM